ncbi:unnamed protein product [Linum tenue]|uniref:D-isomer specific 2-hydroxyacid dehydrogenase catalytic domain-containing protein n=1 Tax=Linum tenue TaxID=586396 RepID=A0AAV0KQ64_9ROSI|nr:unnamed protein product [Linum tenue]
MESIGVLLMCPMYSYLEQELQSRFNLFKLWQQPPSKIPEFLKSNQRTIKAVVSNARVGADAQLIDSLPNLEIVASFSVGFDKIDLKRCEEKGIRVTNTPDVLTDDVADLGIALILAVLRKICPCDGFVRSGKWKDGDFGLSTKVCLIFVKIWGLGVSSKLWFLIFFIALVCSSGLFLGFCIGMNGYLVLDRDRIEI